MIVSPKHAKPGQIYKGRMIHAVVPIPPFVKFEYQNGSENIYDNAQIWVDEMPALQKPDGEVIDADVRDVPQISGRTHERQRLPASYGTHFKLEVGNE